MKNYECELIDEIDCIQEYLKNKKQLEDYIIGNHYKLQKFNLSVIKQNLYERDKINEINSDLLQVVEPIIDVEPYQSEISFIYLFFGLFILIVFFNFLLIFIQTI